MAAQAEIAEKAEKLAVAEDFYRGHQDTSLVFTFWRTVNCDIISGLCSTVDCRM